MKTIVLFTLFCFYSLLYSQEILQFDSIPYKDPILNKVEYLAKAMVLHEKLLYDFNQIKETNKQGIIEELYLLIDSYVKQNFPKSITEFPKPDFMLQNIFSWADTLGVIGAKLVYTVLDSNWNGDSIVKESALFNFKLKGANFFLSSNLNKWKLIFPYHFMIGNHYRATDNSGYKTDFVSIATGFSKQKRKPGYSQATIAFIYTKRRDLNNFISLWKKALGAQKRQVNKEKYIGYKCKNWVRKEYDIYIDFLYKKTRTHCIGIIYSGIKEAYNLNKPHFVNFYESIKFEE